MSGIIHEEKKYTSQEVKDIIANISEDFGIYINPDKYIFCNNSSFSQFDNEEKEENEEDIFYSDNEDFYSDNEETEKEIEENTMVKKTYGNFNINYSNVTDSENDCINSLFSKEESECQAKNISVYDHVGAY